MIRILVISLLAVWLCGSVIAQSDGDYIERAQSAVDSARDGGCEQHVADLQTVYEAEEFQIVLNDGGRLFLLRELLSCAVDLDNRDFADSLLIEAREYFSSTDDYDWWVRYRFGLSVFWSNIESALQTLELAVVEYPAAISSISSDNIWRLKRKISTLEEPSERTEFLLRFYRNVQAANYSPPDPLDDMSSLYVDYARLLLETGETRSARYVVSRDLRASALLELHISKTFDPIREGSAFGDDLSILGMFEYELADARRDVEDYPERLKAVVHLAQAQRRLGQDKEALATLENALSSIENKKRGTTKFSDVSDYLNWVYNERAYVLAFLGRTEEAFESMELGISNGENGGEENVSQVINLSMMKFAADQPAEALETLQRVGSASAYGEMFVLMIETCAATRRGDQDVAVQKAAEMHPSRMENLGAMQMAYLCLDDEESGAALLKERLADKVHAYGVIDAMQQRELDIPEAFTLSQTLRARFEKLIMREDIRTEAEKVGRLLELPVHSTYWANY